MVVYVEWNYCVKYLCASPVIWGKCIVTGIWYPLCAPAVLLAACWTKSETIDLLSIHFLSMLQIHQSRVVLCRYYLHCKLHKCYVQCWSLDMQQKPTLTVWLRWNLYLINLDNLSFLSPVELWRTCYVDHHPNLAHPSPTVFKPLLCSCRVMLFIYIRSSI